MEARHGTKCEQVNLAHLSLNNHRLQGYKKAPKISAVSVSTTVRID